MLSDKLIPRHERLIVALDVDGGEEAMRLVKCLDDAVTFYKLGLQLFMSGGYFELIDELYALGKRVFVDLKFFDVPETVGSAVRSLAKRHNVTFATVHANDEGLRYACREKGPIKILAVTVLTSLDRADLNAMGFKCDVDELVLSRARRALQLGCDGVISSGLEAPKLRGELGQGFLIVTPGIRPVDNDVPNDDQKRVVDVKGAFMNGADYIVVGRPIRSSQDPRKVALDMQQTIATMFPQ